MIQRIQSILLLMAAGAMAGLFALPFASTATAQPEGIFSDSVFDLTDNTILLVLSVIAMAIALIAIFMYKNRKRQTLLNLLGMGFALAVPITAYVLAGKYDDPSTGSSLQAGIFLPVVSLALFAAANYFIRKDDNLVRSMDRLR